MTKDFVPLEAGKTSYSLELLRTFRTFGVTSKNFTWQVNGWQITAHPGRVAWFGPYFRARSGAPGRPIATLVLRKADARE